MNQNQIEEFQGYLLDRYQELHKEDKAMVADYQAGKITGLVYRLENERLSTAKREVNKTIQAFQKIKGGTVK